MTSVRPKLKPDQPKAVTAWDTLTGTKVDNQSAHENRVSCLGVSKDGQAPCTGSWDTLLKIWA